MFLRYKKQVDDLSLHIEVIGAATKPIVRSSPTLLSTHKGLGFVATGKRRKAFLGNDLVLDKVAPTAASALVEQGPDARHYFTLRHARRAPVGAPRMSPSSIHVFWDASRSRRDANHKAELAVLRGFLAKHPNAKVSVYAVRNRLVRLRTGRGVSAARSLANIDYDGASNLGAIRSMLRRGTNSHLNIVVTDGMANYAGPAPMSAKAPTWVLSSTSSANRVWMRQLAASSGGAYLDLRRIKTGEAIASIGRVADTVSVVHFEHGRDAVPGDAGAWVDDADPLLGEAVQQRTLADVRSANDDNGR